MQAVFVRRTVMRYKEHDFQYETENADQVAADDEQRSQRKQYRRGRPARAARRRSSNSSNAERVALGMAGRRKHRWSW